ncbi:MAG: hypothetical protein JSW39_21905 [Desulfobacterales bacterium]|nr:MAG: hypothetical protein JSW39_21905 [Desulfobacterales bacterium]
MKLKNAETLALLTIVAALLGLADPAAAAPVEWNIHNTLQLESAAIDVAVSQDGGRIFVLTDQGKILIYSSANVVEGTIDVGQNVDQIKIGPREDILILNNRIDKTVQVITLDFIQNINVGGSPFKGPENAPIVIAVFDDFQ